jgi:hypothetical protein
MARCRIRRHVGCDESQQAIVKGEIFNEALAVARRLNDVKRRAKRFSSYSNAVRAMFL